MYSETETFLTLDQGNEKWKKIPLSHETPQYL